jgi:transcriptional regulator with XRE-family HTH domain
LVLAPAEIGRRIAEARNVKGWTQLDLAVAMSVSPGTIYRWEAGKLPAADVLLRLAEQLGLQPDSLVRSPEYGAELSQVREVVEFLNDRQQLLVETVERHTQILEELLARVRSLQSARESDTSEP